MCKIYLSFIIDWYIIITYNIYQLYHHFFWNIIHVFFSFYLFSQLLYRSTLMKIRLFFVQPMKKYILLKIGQVTTAITHTKCRSENDNGRDQHVVLYQAFLTTHSLLTALHLFYFFLILTHTYANTYINVSTKAIQLLPSEYDVRI